MREETMMREDIGRTGKKICECNVRDDETERR